MLEELKSVLETALFTAPGDKVITVGQIAGVVLLLVFGYLGSRLVGYLLGKRLAGTKLRPDVIYVLKRIAFFVILVIVVITALDLLGIPLTAFAFATGALAIGVGFGAQNIINNFISGWILMVERPIRIGDFIEIDGAQGVIENIGNRSTRIRRTDGVHLLVPNSLLLERTVVNWTLIDLEIRSTVRVGVAYGSPVRLVADLILQAVNEQKEVKKEPAPSVIFDDFGDNALAFDAYFWCDASGEKFLREIRGSIRFRISELFEQNGIVIAFPQRDVHLDSSSPLEIRMIGKETDDE
ncbi:MAG: mechanosensitive ion channel [Gammaproteobacteria bacterium]|nr:mechanosensitive ion channel [Gammaproteobacteria bacterium]